MGLLGIKLANTQQISVEMEDLSLTKRSGRLKVNIGAVLRTRMNTGDCHLVKASGYVRWKTEREAVRGGLREMSPGSRSIRFTYFLFT
jgi:hypothetical protein